MGQASGTIASMCKRVIKLHDLMLNRSLSFCLSHPGVDFCF